MGTKSDQMKQLMKDLASAPIPLVVPQPMPEPTIVAEVVEIKKPIEADSIVKTIQKRIVKKR